MYIYFKFANSVLTCEEYPQILSVEEMKLNNLENICNKWDIDVWVDGTFTLSFKYTKHICECDNSCYTHLDDYGDYECYTCGIPKPELYKEGDNLYLQNSGNMDIVCVNPSPNFSLLCPIPGCHNAYQWENRKNTCIYALHIRNGMLSDADVSNDIGILRTTGRMFFTERV